jgi:hypothetical protein
MMRQLMMTAAALIVTNSTAWAQPTPSSSVNPYGLDPYKPSEAAILREFGAALVSQTPVSELAALDPYKPSHAAILRLAGGLPVWAIGWPTALVMLAPDRTAAVPAPTSFPPSFDERGARRDVRPEPSTEPPPGPTAVATILPPESNDGIWIAYDGRRWLLAGGTVEFEAPAYERIGQLAGGHAVYRLRDGDAALIFVASGDRSVVPYREKR